MEKYEIKSALLDIQQTSEFLNITVSKLKYMIFRNEIKSLKIGRLRRFHIDDLNEFIEKMRKKASK